MLFQSTLPQRERPGGRTARIQHKHFNPRSHKGSDDTLDANMGQDAQISIHAPTKGATAILHKILNLYCGTLTNNTQINSLIININYINRIKTSILNYFLVRITL